MHPRSIQPQEQQLRNLDAFEDVHYLTRLEIEKAPSVTGLRSLPRLIRLLDLANQEQTQVVIDDVRRIFYRCPRGKRRTLFEEVRKFFVLIRDLRHEGMLLSEIDLEAWIEIMNVDGPPQFELMPREVPKRPKAKRVQQTAVARRVSARVRSKRSDISAARIVRLRSELLAEGGSATLKQIADAANAKGLRTTRGNNWTPAAVSRALKRHHDKEGSLRETEGQSQQAEAA